MDAATGYHRHVAPWPLSTDEVRWMLRDDGYRDIRFFDDHGPVYRLTARKHGGDYFLAVSARAGEIYRASRI